MGVLADIILVLSEGGVPSSFPERLWSQNRGKKSFFDKYFRPSCGPIESAMTPDSLVNGKRVPGTGERT
jgi:hypothetical protein